MNAFYERHKDEIERILVKYPPEHKRSAMLPLLYLAQRDRGYITREDMAQIAEILEVSVTEVDGVVGFYTLLHDKPGGKYRIQVCTDLPCALRGAEAFLRQLEEALGIKAGETTPDGLITLEEVMCIAACDKAPVFQVQTGEGLTYHENMDLEKTLALIESWRRAESPPSRNGGAPVNGSQPNEP